MFNLTITIWPIIDEIDPESLVIGQTALNDQEQKNRGLALAHRISKPAQPQQNCRLLKR